MATSPHYTHLPQELVELVVDFCSGDPSRLAALLATSSVFGQRVRTHRYKHVALVLRPMLVEGGYSVEYTPQSAHLITRVSSNHFLADAVQSVVLDATFIEVWELPHAFLITDLGRFRRLKSLHFGRSLLVGRPLRNVFLSFARAGTRIHLPMTASTATLYELSECLSANNALELSCFVVSADRPTSATTPYRLSASELVLQKSASVVHLIAESPGGHAVRRLILQSFNTEKNTETLARNSWTSLPGMLSKLPRLEFLYLQITWSHLKRDFPADAAYLLDVPSLVIHVQSVAGLSWIVRSVLDLRTSTAKTESFTVVLTVVGLVPYSGIAEQLLLIAGHASLGGARVGLIVMCVEGRAAKNNLEEWKEASARLSLEASTTRRAGQPQVVVRAMVAENHYQLYMAD